MRLVLPLWLLFVVTLCLIPLPLKVQLGTTGSYHQLGHFVIFFVTAVLLCRKTRSLREKFFRAGGAVVLGAILEGLEVFFYRNSFEWKDVFTDTAGIVLGLGAVLIAGPLSMLFRRGVQL